MSEGLKFDGKKTMHELVPPYAQEQYAKVLTFGAQKYAPHNWEKGIEWSRIIGAIKRHTLAIERGEDYDPETGLLHSAHLMCEAGFLTEFYKVFPQGDNRFIPELRGYRVGLDIDDVLADFCGAYCERFDMERPKFWNFDSLFSERYAELMKDRDFWMNINPLCTPDSLPFEPVCYITSRGVAKEITEEWLRVNGFPPAPVHYSGMEGSKVDIAKSEKLDIFVDDRFENFAEMNNAGIFTFLFDAPHNKRYRVGHKRIKSLSDIFANL